MPSSILLIGRRAGLLSTDLKQHGLGIEVAADAREGARLLALPDTQLSVVLCSLDSDVARLAQLALSRWPRPAFIFVYSGQEATQVLAVLEQGGVAIPAQILLEKLETLKGFSPRLDRHETVAMYAREHKLGPRETQVLDSTLLGDSRGQAADRIGCSAPSVATYWRRICRKTRKLTQADVLLDLLRFAIEGNSHRLTQPTEVSPGIRREGV